MKIFPVRVTAAASAFCVAAAFSGIGAAGAAETTGLGTSKASFSLVSLELGKAGSLLNVQVLLDQALSSVDTVVSTPNALSKLVPFSLTSEVAPALNGITGALPTFESKTPGGQAEVNGAAVDFAQGGSGLPLLGALPIGGLFGGQLVPTKLSTGLDAKGARSDLVAALTNLSVGGILSLKSVSDVLGTSAGTQAAAGTRGVDIGAISFLTLGDLLKGLKIDLASLPLGIINDLLKNLNLLGNLPLAGAPDLTSAVALVTGVLDSTLKTVAGSSGVVGQVVKAVPAVSGLVPNLPALLPVLGGAGGLGTIKTDTLLDGTVGGLVTTLTGTLQGLLGSALGTLGNLSLLSLDGAKVNVATSAARTLQDSVATATAQLGGLSVLGLKLPGVDLAAIGNTLNTVTGTISGALGILGLGNLLDVKLLNKATNVVTEGGYNKATASFDVLSIALNPPANLAGIVSGLLGAGTNSSPLAILGAAGVAQPAAALPLIGGNAGALGGLLNLGPLVGALTEGLTLKVGTMASASELATTTAPDQPLAAAPTAVAELPRTGGTNTGTFAAMAAVLAALSLGLRRWSRRPSLVA